MSILFCVAGGFCLALYEIYTNCSEMYTNCSEIIEHYFVTSLMINCPSVTTN